MKNLIRRRKELGIRGEETAVAFLREKGYRIVERNFRCPLGEVDIIALQKEYVVFIEVKTRSSRAFGLPQEGVNRRKQLKLRKLAEYYLKHKGMSDYNCRFDVVGIEVDQHGYSKVEVIQDAF